MSIRPRTMCPLNESSWTLRPLNDVSFGLCVLWTMSPLDDASQYNPLRTGGWCRVDVSPNDVSPTESSWMFRPWTKASLGYCVPDRCVPTLDRVKHGTSSVGLYRGLGRPPAPNGSVGRLAGFAYAPDQVYWIGAPPSDSLSGVTANCLLLVRDWVTTYNSIFLTKMNSSRSK